MKVFKIISYAFFSLIAFVVLLLIVSIFPITGNYKVMVVQSGSMEPAIKTGSVVIVKPDSDYEVGDIISFSSAKSSKTIITHRIAEIIEKDGQKSYMTKGDANNGQDSSEVSKENVLGKVFFSVPYLGYVVHVAKKPYGFIAIVAIPALFVIFDEIKKINNEVVKIKAKKEESA